ncbi:MAG: cupin domain-containing protein [Planctomycetota bacterium]
MIVTQTLEIISGGGAVRPWNGELCHLFHFSRSIVQQLTVDQQVGRLQSPCIAYGTIDLIRGGANQAVEGLKDYSVQLRSPFEDVASISGGVWKGQDIFNERRNDAIVKLEFAPNTTKLPMHSHSQSDRCILILSGSGTFEFSPNSTQHDAQRISRPVKPGCVIAFTRNVVHTFKTKDERLVLLSYHSPFIPLDSPDQFTIAE